MIATMTSKDYETQSMKMAASAVLAINECNEELRSAALELMVQLVSNRLDESEERSICSLLSEILFPNTDDGLLDSDAIASARDPEIAEVLADLDRQERTFAERLKSAMDDRGVTQVVLAEKVGIGQPAISMMLNRTCRPQKKTVQKLAAALGVEPGDLWPS